ncbi:MAG TPA: class I SAM-dependent methyltransferase [Holophagaceae bacterium]|nr:class I SAM-dependent methyltransferase [Holophagaceae bacterium]
MDPLRPDYGIDAPGVVRNLFLASAVGLALFGTALAELWSGAVLGFPLAGAGLWTGLGCAGMGTWMLYDSRIGKLKERERLLDLAALRGSDQVLDVGCGRGLMLVGAARRLSTGRATGLDLWSQEDLSGNRPEATLENAAREGVADRVEVRTGDMREMPFADACFDAVVSNVAIHNIYDREGRRKAMAEIARVLRPGGRLVIHDIRHVAEYAEDLSGLGLARIQRRGSKAAQVLLLLLTWGSLRPDILTAEKPLA